MKNAKKKIFQIPAELSSYVYVVEKEEHSFESLCVYKHKAADDSE